MARKPKKTLKAAGRDARDTRAAARSAVDNLGTATGEALSSVAATMGPALRDTGDRLSPAVSDARNRVGPAVSDARGRVAPVVAQARGRFAPVVTDTRDRIAPVVTDAVASRRAKGLRAAQRAGLVEEPKKSHKVRNLVILTGLGGASAFAYAKLTGKDADPAWTASRDAGTAHRPAPAPDGSDAAPSAPLPSEETVSSPTPTTPDDPIEKKRL